MTDLPRRLIASLALLLAAACGGAPTVPQAPPAAADNPGRTAVAVFAGGCFWCMEAPFDVLPGVLATRSGFSGGRTERPSYEAVTAGGTGHLEVVEVTYDPDRISYARLLETYWRQVDPFDGEGQFCDRGDSYRPAVFTATPGEREEAERQARALAARFGGPLSVEIRQAAPFWPAEAYHQDYYQRNRLRYSYYRSACGRDARLRAVWGEAAAVSRH